MTKYDSSVVTIKRNGQRADFGSAFSMTVCPNCQRFMKWRPSTDGVDKEPGIYVAVCCSRKYEMYMETVTINMVQVGRAKVTPVEFVAKRHYSDVAKRG
jgi:hypothetical protein